MEAHQRDLVAEFSAVTGANPSAAQATLESANWDLEQAVTLFFAASDAPEPTHEEDFDEDEEDEPRTAAQPSSSSNPQPAPTTSTRRPPGSRPKQMTLADLQRGQGDDDDEDEKDQDMFAGGEKSGLAVQNPNAGNNSGGPIDHFKNIMNQARQNRDRPAGEDDDAPAGPGNARTSAFTGRAQTLGGDDAPSQVIEDPRQRLRSRNAAAAPQRVNRTLHLWADGVSIDDGPLFRFDDPANQDMMTQINQGRAPLSLLDVQPDQEVDLNLIPHKGENYVQPKQKYKPFGGSGQRLGSPTPSSSTGTTSFTTQPAAPSTTTSSDNKPAEMHIDESAPTLQLQIRLGDGTRLQSRFNTTHTIGDVYDFVNRASAASTQRPWALMTTFPSRELEDKAQVLGEMSDFKRGGVVVQKWK